MPFPIKRAWLTVLLSLISLECLPFWMFQRFPSQDGPSHLYNATVLANYQRQTEYQNYYSVGFPLDGNVATQAVVVGLLKTGFAPQMAEKLLLTVYAVLLLVCFWYLLDAISSQANTFSLFAILLIPNFFLHKGFWNFCFSIPIALLALGYYVRHRESWRVRSIVVFAILGGILYLAHIAAWGVFAIAVAAYEIASRLSTLLTSTEPISTRPPPLIISARQVVALCTLIPPGALTVVYSLTAQTRSHAGAALPASLRSRVLTLCGLSFLHTISPSDLVTAKLIALLLAVLFLSALIYRVRRWRGFRPADAFFLVAAVCATLAIFGPDAVGDGSYIRMRVALFAWVFLVLWIAAQSWNTWIIRTLWTVIPLIAIVSLLARLPEYRRWDNVLREFTSMGRQIRPGAAVLSVRTDRNSDNIRPLLHAVDLFAPRPFIDLCNYEAETDQFPLRFRRDRSPESVLGNPAELEQVPPIFHIARYEAQTLGCVDYVLVYALPKFVSGGEEASENYEAKLRAYKLIYGSESPLKAQLYARRQSCR